MKKRRLFAVLSILTLVIAAIAFLLVKTNGKNGKEDSAAKEDAGDITGVLRSSVVMITVGEYHGGGVIVELDDTGMTVVTVYHLMEGYDQGIISFTNGKTGFGTVKKSIPERDLCFLRLEAEDMSEGFTEGLKKAELKEGRLSEIVEGEQVYLVGSQTGTAVNMTVATLNSTSYYVPEFDLCMLYLSADVSAGMSGAGCFDSEGCLIGLLAGGSETSEAVCISAEDIIEEMKEG